MNGVTAQRLVGLERANDVRQPRAALRREVHALPYGDGRARLADLLVDPPECMVSARLEDVLTWPWRMDRRQVNRLRTAAGVVGSRSLGQLTERQRAVIAGALREIGGAR